MVVEGAGRVQSSIPGDFEWPGTIAAESAPSYCPSPRRAIRPARQTTCLCPDASEWGTGNGLGEQRVPFVKRLLACSHPRQSCIISFMQVCVNAEAASSLRPIHTGDSGTVRPPPPPPTRNYRRTPVVIRQSWEAQTQTHHSRIFRTEMTPDPVSASQTPLTIQNKKWQSIQTPFLPPHLANKPPLSGYLHYLPDQPKSHQDHHR